MVILWSLASGGEKSKNLIIADFNTGRKPSNIGGDFGAWDKDPKDFDEICLISFSKTMRLGDKGYSLRVDYDVDSPRPAWNGVWFKLNNLNFDPFNTLNIWLKGDKLKGYTTVFKIELKNSRGEVGKYYVTGISNEWKKFSIPFEQFLGITDFSRMRELVFVFEDRIATKKTGAIYVDNIYLSKEGK